MPKGRPAAAPIRWREHPEYDDWLRGFVPGHSDLETIDAFEREFGVRLTPAQVGNRKQALGLRSGTVGGRFERGHEPHNKGRRWGDYMTPEQMERASAALYRKGNLPHNAVPVGAERVSRDGYVEVHVAQFRTSRANDQWVHKHRLVWERENGRKLEKGEVVVFCDGDKSNFDPANLAVATQAEMALINRRGIPYFDRESFRAARSIARLNLVISDRERAERPCATCGATFKPRYKNQRNCDACVKSGRKLNRMRGRKGKTGAREERDGQEDG